MNHLYYGDNLRVLRESIKDVSVDLIYLDPPFACTAGLVDCWKQSTCHTFERHHICL
jgi:16S rRNA G966 N2-methylase RsmD